MIGEKFSENHPIIMSFNANLVEIYSQYHDKEDKTRAIIPICEKNIEIASNSYGDLSIYALRFYLALASNHIANGKIQAAN